MEDKGLDGQIILKLILKKWDMENRLDSSGSGLGTGG
jgi:hypothetical protein